MKVRASAIVSVFVVAALVGVLAAIPIAPAPHQRHSLLPRAYVHEVDISTTLDTGHGSGVMIAPHVMLTVRHVAKAGALAVDGKQAAVLAISRRHDIALLWVSLGCPCAPIADLTPNVGTHLFAVGYPLDMGQVETTGTMQSTKREWLRMSLPIAPGNSGGGIFVKAHDRYELVGLADAMGCEGAGGVAAMCFPSLSLAESTATIHDFLRGFLCRYGGFERNSDARAVLASAASCAMLSRTEKP